MERHPKGHHTMRQDTNGREKSRKDIMGKGTINGP